MNPKISIIIPTINRYDDLDNTIKDLHQQSIQDFEIIIIDQTDSSLFKLIEQEKVIHLHKKYKSASKARNTGLIEANSPIVLYLDDDIIIKNKDFLKNHLKHFENPNNPGVSGAILNLDEKFATQLPKRASHKYLGWIYFPRNYNKLAEICDGGAGNLSVRKNWAIAVGGMDENYDKGAYREESDFCLRLTRKYGNLIYDPEAELIHIGNPSGGTRSWKNSKGVIHAQQHMFGAWYFMFRQLPLIVWPEYSYLTTRRFIFHKKLFINFYLLPKAIFLFTMSFFKAIVYSKKPKYIKL